MLQATTLNMPRPHHDGVGRAPINFEDVEDVEEDLQDEEDADKAGNSDPHNLTKQNFQKVPIGGKMHYRCNHCESAFSGKTSTTRLR